MISALNNEALDLIFNNARTHNFWQPKPVSESLLRTIYDLARLGPTSANTSPMRIVFVQSPQAKELLRPCLAPGNVEKTMSAPVTAVIGMDMKFFDRLPELFPQADARSWFKDLPEAALAEAALRNSSLQAAYLILAARSVGLDCGPMSGFDQARADAAFFAGTSVRTNLLINLGYGDSAKVFPRNPRLAFADACKII